MKYDDEDADENNDEEDDIDNDALITSEVCNVQLQKVVSMQVYWIRNV